MGLIISSYGSVRGIRGGFFTLGVNAGFKNYLTDKVFIDTGIHFGGGGGAGAPDGGGAFILPHVNLGIQFKKFSFTTGYSYINFFDKGAIENQQLRLLTPGKTITIAVGDGGATVGVSGAGGKGVVILSMPDAGYTGTITGSPTVATGVSGKTILTFTGTGSYVT